MSVRRAHVGDVDALVELRAVMFETMGQRVSTPGWRSDARVWFAERLGDPDFRTYVFEDDGDVVSCASGWVVVRGPSPENRSGRIGHIANTATLPAHRGRGHARACLEALLRWFDEEAQVPTVELNATPSGDALYRAAGFGARTYPTLVRRRLAR